MIQPKRPPGCNTVEQAEKRDDTRREEIGGDDIEAVEQRFREVYARLSPEQRVYLMFRSFLNDRNPSERRRKVFFDWLSDECNEKEKMKKEDPARSDAKERIELIRQKVAPMFFDDTFESVSDEIRGWILVDDELGSVEEKEQAVSDMIAEALKHRDANL